MKSDYMPLSLNPHEKLDEISSVNQDFCKEIKLVKGFCREIKLIFTAYFNPFLKHFKLLSFDVNSSFSVFSKDFILICKCPGILDARLNKTGQTIW